MALLSLVEAGTAASAASPTGMEGATSPLYAEDLAFYDSDDAELPPSARLSNRFVNPLCGLHQVILFNMTPQMELGTLQLMASSASNTLSRAVAATPLHQVVLGTGWAAREPLKPQAPAHVTTPLDQAAVLCVMRAYCLSALNETAEAAKLFQALQDPSVASALRHEKWVTAYAFYGHAVQLFGMSSDGPAQCQAKLQEMKQRLGSTDYNFEMQMQFRAHLTQHVLSKPGEADMRERKDTGATA
jgi:hypothetical protein